MERVYIFMEDIYNIYNKIDRRYMEIRPRWKEKYNIRYKYYYNDKVRIHFDLDNKKLIIKSKSEKYVDEYEINYPRFTSRGNMQDSKYFNFFFSVKDQTHNAVIIVKADNIINLAEMYESKLNIKVEKRNNYLSELEILEYQEYIYRDLGLGLGLKSLDVKDRELEKLDITREEFTYAVTELIIRAENFYLINKLRDIGIKEEEYLNILQKLVDCKLEDGDLKSKLIIRYEISELDYMTIRVVANLKMQNMERKKALVKLIRNKFDSLDKLVDRIEKLVYLDEIESLTIGMNVGQTLKEYGFEIKDINISKITMKLIHRVADTNLSIIEMLEIILNHKRYARSILKLDDIRQGSKIGTLVI